VSRALVLLLLACIGGAAIAEPAHRIVSLAPHLTELAFDAGAGQQIVGVDEYSDHPDAARRIPRVGNAFRVDFERVIALKPDVILVWNSGTPRQVIDQLRAVKLRVVEVATYELSDIAQAVRQIGRLAGTEQVAGQAADQYDHALKDLRERYRSRTPISVFLEVNDQPLYTVNGKQIMSQAIELCGGRNIFADLNELAPAVGIEAVLAANPDVILSIDDTVPKPREHWQQWKQLQAIRHDNVFAMPADDLARPTLRLIHGIEVLCEALDKARSHLGSAS
jgi:iron complex transport system substrate-binding protein